MTGKIEKSGESVGNYIRLSHIRTGKTIARVPWGDKDNEIADDIVSRWNKAERTVWRLYHNHSYGTGCDVYCFQSDDYKSEDDVWEDLESILTALGIDYEENQKESIEILALQLDLINKA